MTKQLQVWKCEKCGNIVEVLHGEGAPLFCCGEKMVVFEEKTADSATEKHVPVVEKTADGYKVTIGSTLHPMADDHYIEFIELLADGLSYKKFLKPGDEPVAVFAISADQVSAREYCNKHGLWKA